MDRALLELQDVSVTIPTYRGLVHALDQVSLSVSRGEVFGLVGESGCGKTMTALTILGLLPERARVSGQILLEGQDLLRMSPLQIREVRRHRIAMVFQDPSTFFNPVLNIGQQLAEVLTDDDYDGTTPKPAREISRLLHDVGLPDPDRIARQYPHELSGGMRQRAMISMAIARKPELIIADEITTALDVTTQAQILALLREIRRSIRMSILLITHDLGIVAEMCDRMGVMYAGHVVEVGTVTEVIEAPQHPYTQGLLRAIPDPWREQQALETIGGLVPDLIHPPSGCPFHPRCPYAFPKCPSAIPPMYARSKTHSVACYLYEEDRR